MALQLREPFIDSEALDTLFSHYGESARYRGEALNKLIANLADAPRLQQLRETNRFFNQFRYREDLPQWGVKDYWQTPLEFLGSNSGDCEDYVIAKYFTLLAMGVEEERLYLTYVKATRENVAHMVLSYYESSSSVPLILDNYIPQIQPATERPDLIPVYSFNGDSLFLSGSAGLGTALPTDRIKNSKWDLLLNRVRGEKP